MKKVIVLLLLIISMTAKSQPSGHFYSLSAGFGNTIKHSERVADLLGPYRVYDFRWGVYSDGSKYWQQAYHYPSYGIGISYGNMLNVNLGHAYAAYAFIDYPIAEFGKIALTADLVAGVSYFNNPYDETTNPTNFALSSYFEAKLEVGGKINYELAPHFQLSLWGGLGHYSDGSLTVPNSGINALLIKLGLSYSLNDQKRITTPVDMPKFYRQSIDVYGALSYFKVESAINNPFHAATSQIMYNYRIGYKSKIGAGFDLTNDSSLKGSPMRSAMLLSHDLIMNKVSLGTQFAVNFKWNYGQTVYQRISLRYWVNDNLSGSVALRTVWANAQFIELGLGYSFGWDKR